MLMVQTKPQATVKSVKLKPPPPVPPRPNQNVVAEALAKTRKAVAESKLVTKSRPLSKDEQKAKTLERTNVAAASQQNTSPKLNGLARVKSFIRDVISDRSSSDEKKSTSNSRRSSVDAVSANAKSPAESKSAGKTIKSCRQALVRSLSISTKLEQESKSRVLKSSSSFAEKALPLRKAPPPPLSPKPKLREVKPSSVPKRNSMDIKKPRVAIPSVDKPTVPTPKTQPFEVPKPSVPPVAEAPYATVDEVTDFDNRLSNTSESPEPVSVAANGIEDSTKSTTPPPKYMNSLERKTSRVTERLISEIIASKNKPTDCNGVIDKGKETDNVLINDSTELVEGETVFKDMNNHEILIYELQTMRSQTQIPKSETDDVMENLNSVEDDKNSSGRFSPTPSVDISEMSEHSALVDPAACEDDDPNAREDDGPSVCEDDDPEACDGDDPLKSRLRKQFRAISSMSLQGLPPLPKSLSGFAEGPLDRDGDSDSPGTPEELPKPGDLESQLAYLKREMAGLRRLDLSLLSELWSLNEAMASWRQQLERAPRLRPAPPPPPHYLRT